MIAEGGGCTVKGCKNRILKSPGEPGLRKWSPIGNNLYIEAKGVFLVTRGGEYKKQMINRSSFSFVKGFQISLCKVNQAIILELTRVAPDIRPFLISGIRPDIRFRLPNIRLAGYPARKILDELSFLANLVLH